MKTSTIVGSGIGLVMVFGIAGIALAMEMKDSMHKDSMMPSSVMMMHPPKPMVLTVSTSGNGLLRGVVTSVGTTSLMVATWGGVWTVNVTGATSITPSGDLSMIAVGDFVGVRGSVSEDGPIITADIVRDWTSQHDRMMMKHEDTIMNKNDGAMMHKDDHMMSSSTDSMHH